MNLFRKDKLHLFKGDLRKEEDIDKVFKYSLDIKKPIYSVIHFAGLKSISESNRYPLDYWDSNVVGTIKLLKIMEKYNCKNFVFSSSASVYKAASNKLLNECGIAVTPGSFFGSKGSSNIRFSYVCGLSEIDDAIKRLQSCFGLKSYK